MTKKAPATGAPGHRSLSRVWRVLLVLGIVLLAANLRAALTSVAPLVGQIRADTGISNGMAGLLTALPLLAFGVLSPIAPRLAHRFGIERVLLASMLVLAAGILLRSVGAIVVLFLGTIILGAGIAVGNVLLPGLIKREFTGRAGLMTSTYSTAMAISAATAAGVSFPLADQTGAGWRGSLALWALLAFLAAVAWAPRPGAVATRAHPPKLPVASADALGACLAGDAVHGLAVTGLLRGADVAPGDPAGGGRDERGAGRLDARASAGGGILSIFLAPCSPTGDLLSEVSSWWPWH